jgi:hypothetical protein
MGDMPKVVTICGSTRWKANILDAARRLTLGGHIVLPPLVFGHHGDRVTESEKVMLDDLHLRKIDLSQLVYVVNPDGRIGDSTRREIRYAESRGIPVQYETTKDSIR